MRTDPIGRFALPGRPALVTGASSGLGARIASTLSAADAELVLTGRSRERLRKFADGLAGTPTIVPGDLSEAGFRTALVEEVRARPLRRPSACS